MPDNQVGWIPEQLWQNFIAELSADLNVDPAQARQYFLSNLVGRELSYLMAWRYDTGNPTRVRTNPDGSLRVSSTGTVFSDNYSTQLNLGAGASQTINFPKATSRLDIWAVATDLSVERSIDGNVFQDGILVYSGGYLSVDANQLAVKVTNVSGSVNNTGQVVGWA